MPYKDKEKRKEAIRKSKEKNKSYYQSQNTDYNHRDEVVKRKAEWYQKNKHKRLDTPQKKLRNSIRCRLRSALNGCNGKKAISAVNLLGVEIDEYKKYLESLFEEGMNWDNYGWGDGKWTIDHIKPCSWFNLELLEEQQKCFHYSNTKPMWFLENVGKKNRYEG